MLTAGLDMGRAQLLWWNGTACTLSAKRWFYRDRPVKKITAINGRESIMTHPLRRGTERHLGFCKYAGKLCNYRNQGLCRRRTPVVSRCPDHPRYWRSGQQSDTSQPDGAVANSK